MNHKKIVDYNKPTKFKYILDILYLVITGIFLFNFLRLVGYYIVNYILGRTRSSIGKNSNVHPTVIIRHGKNVMIGDNCLINHNNVIQAGKSAAKINIGNYVQTGPNVMMFAYNHRMEMNGVPMILQNYTEADINIEDDVWIGAGAIILAGVTLGRGSVVGAGAVVTRDVEPYSVVVSPAAKSISLRQ